MNATRATVEMGVREYARTPVLVALLLFLPAYFVGVFTRIVPGRRMPVDVPGAGVVHVDLTTAVAVLTTPLAVALVGGVAGLFLMQAARDVDGRLAIVGARVREILVARGLVLALAAVVASVVALAVLATTYVPEEVGWFLAATVLVGLTYGALGALTGLVLNRLAGVYVLLFGPLLDVFLAQSPFADADPAVAPFLPAHFSTRLAFDAAFTPGVALDALWGALAYLALVGALAGVAFARTVSAS